MVYMYIAPATHPQPSVQITTHPVLGEVHVLCGAIPLGGTWQHHVSAVRNVHALDTMRLWSYRDRSLEKYSRFPAKLSKSGPDKPKRIVGRPTEGAARGQQPRDRSRVRCGTAAPPSYAAHCHPPRRWRRSPRRFFVISIARVTLTLSWDLSLVRKRLYHIGLIHLGANNTTYATWNRDRQWGPHAWLEPECV